MARCGGVPCATEKTARRYLRPASCAHPIEGARQAAAAAPSTARRVGASALLSPAPNMLFPPSAPNCELGQFSVIYLRFQRRTGQKSAALRHITKHAPA